MKKVLLILLRVFVFVIIVSLGLTLIWDQVAYDFGDELGMKQTGFLKAIGLVGVIEGFTTNHQFLGYSLIFYGSAAMFVFLAFALVLQLIPILGKIMIFIAGIIPIVAVIVIVFGVLIWTDVIHVSNDLKIPGFTPPLLNLSPVVFPVSSF